MEGFLTKRERIIRVLMDADRPLTVEEIADRLGLDRSEAKGLYEELAHASRTLNRATQGRMVIAMVPPRCLSCGYVFKDVKRPRRPSRCPKCKSERISRPMFTIIKV